MKFQLGTVFLTSGVMRALKWSTWSTPQKLSDPEITNALDRHGKGDWGDVCEEDKLDNDASLLDGSRLLSSYKTKDGTKFWIITEADRSSTTVLLPEEY